MSADVDEVLGRDHERALTTELARAVVEEIAPDEIDLGTFELAARDHFENPAAVLPRKPRDEPLGSGIPTEILEYSPYVFAVLVPVVRYLCEIVVTAAKEEVKSRLVDAVRRLYRANTARPSDTRPTRLTPDQTERVRKSVYDNLRAAQGDELATVFANAVVGQLMTEDRADAARDG